MNKLLTEIKANIEYMSPTERKISEVILRDPKRFTAYSLSELSEVSQVSQGSIVNFSNKFCGGGFAALKIEIAASLSYESYKPFSIIGGTDTVKDSLSKTANDINDALKNTFALNDGQTLSDVADMLLNAKKIDIYGVFRSAVVATDLYYQLLQIGMPATFVSDVLTCAVSASMLGEGSLVVAISSSGETQDIIDAVKLAKKNNVPVVAITAHKNSHLAKLSDKTLLAAPSGNSLSANANEVRMSQLALTDAICAYLRNKMDPDGNNRYFKMSEILTSHNVRD